MELFWCTAMCGRNAWEKESKRSREMRREERWKRRDEERGEMGDERGEEGKIRGDRGVRIEE